MQSEILTNERVITAFIGALVALFLKVFYDYIIELKRREDIRKMIYIDLVNQKEAYTLLKGICEQLVKFANDEIDYYSLQNSDLLSTNVFKSYTARDYYKTFNKEYYKRLMFIYYNIELHSKNLIKIGYDKYIAELKENNEDVDEKFAKYFEELIKAYSYMADYIEKQIEHHKKEYAIAKKIAEEKSAL